MAFNKKSVLENNIKAINIALSNKKITEEERNILKSYKGFGGIKGILLPYDQPQLFTKADIELIPLFEKLHNEVRSLSKDPKEYDDYIKSIKNSVLTSFYTPIEVVQAINSCFSDIEINRMLEPSAGVGAFLEHLEAKEKVGIEKDFLTGKILHALNPDKDIFIQPFEQIKTNHLESYDLVASNIPFGNFMIFDPIYAQGKDKEKKKSLSRIHNYFFLKGIDMLRNGGILAYITSTGVMDSKENAFIRKSLLEKSNLISAIRLPNNLFSNTGGIEVHSDLIVLQKNVDKKSLSSREKLFLKSSPDNVNEYYQDLKNVVHSKIEYTTNQYGKPVAIFTEEGGVSKIAETINRILSRDMSINFDKGLFNSYQDRLSFSNVVPGTKSAPIQLDLFADPYEFVEQVKQPKSNIKTEEELLYERQFSDYSELKQVYYSLLEMERISGVEQEELRENLNNVYDKFISDYGFLNLSSNALIINDSNFIEIRGLELFSDKSYIKSDIFKEPISIIKDKISYSIEDALSACLNELNIVNLDYISKLSGEDKQTIKLTLNGKIYFNPIDNEFQLSTKFLSGNVVEKLDRLKSYYSLYDESFYIDSVVTKAELKQSISALENVQPAIIPLEEIGLNFGERWIPSIYYEKFSKSIFNPVGIPEYEKGCLSVKYFPGTDIFDCRIQKAFGTYAQSKFSVKSANRYYGPVDVYKQALIDTIPNMTKKIIRDDQEIIIPDKEGIQKFTSAIDEIRSTFKVWLLSLPENDKINIETIYNKKFNNIVKANYDGSFQKFPDLQLENIGIKELYPSQKNAIMMLKNNGGGIVDHEVLRPYGHKVNVALASYQARVFNACH